MNESIQLFDQAEVTRRAISLASLTEQPRSVPLLVALAGSPGIPDVLDVDDVLKATLNAFVGFQPLKPGMPSLAFLMKSKYVETINDPTADPFGTKQIPYSGMAIHIVSQYAELGKPLFMRQWRQKIAQYLIDHAEEDRLWDDKVGGVDAVIDRMKHDMDPKIGLDAKDIMVKYHEMLKFNLQRKMSAIAKVTRRGMGNRIVGSRSAVEDLLEHIPESQQSRLKIIVYEDGEVQSKPWLLVGYNGSNPYDTGLAFVYQGNSKYGRGALVDNDVKKYWRRII